MQLNPYIAFDGNGQDAIEYYCATLGGEIVMSMKFGDMPEQGDWITDQNRDRLAHATIRIGDMTIMASDTPGFEPHKGFEGVTLQVTCDTKDEAEGFFNKLAADGEVLMPFAKTFWSDGFGMLKDKFGVPWMLNVA